MAINLLHDGSGCICQWMGSCGTFGQWFVCYGNQCDCGVGLDGTLVHHFQNIFVDWLVPGIHQTSQQMSGCVACWPIYHCYVVDALPFITSTILWNICSTHSSWFFNQREIFPWKIFGMSEKYHYGRQFKGESGPVNLVPTADLNCIFHLYYYTLWLNGIV